MVGSFRIALRGWGAPRWRHHHGGGGRGSTQARRATSDASASRAPQVGANAVLKAGLISGSLSLLGDVLAQLATQRPQQQQANVSSYDVARAARMGSFGLCFYGPYQHYWYRALDARFPGRALGNFVAKVALNQLCLAPIVIAGVFAWNLALQGQLAQWPRKAEADFVPTLLNGWKFWVPAASVNFTLVPLQHQVLYMSCCGVLWTGYLSFSSSQKR